MLYSLDDMRYVRIVNPEMYHRVISLAAVRRCGDTTFRVVRQCADTGDNSLRLFFPLQ